MSLLPLSARESWRGRGPPQLVTLTEADLVLRHRSRESRVVHPAKATEAPVGTSSHAQVGYSLGVAATELLGVQKGWFRDGGRDRSA